MIETIPLNLTDERPGTADWRRSSNDDAVSAAIDYFVERDLYQSTTDIIVDNKGVKADVFTDDPKMKTELDEYFKLNNALRVQYTDDQEVEPSHSIRIIYLTDNGVNLGGESIGVSGLPYEGLYDGAGKNFLAAGRKTIGTYKSLVIGAMSGVLASNYDMLPVHSAIVQAPNGNSVGFSGRGNTGKTTSMLSVFERLANVGFKIVTDDWAMIDETSRRIYPVDYLVSVRPESIDGLKSINSDDWTKELTQKVISIEQYQNKIKPLSVPEAFGANMVGEGGVLKAVVFTSLRKLFEDKDGVNIPVNFQAVDTPSSMGVRLRDDAYHAPEITPSVKTQHPLDYRYTTLSGQLACSLVFTRADDSQRKEQTEQMSDWAIRQAA